MLLILLHPEVAVVDCRDCCRFRHDKRWRREENPPGVPVPRRGPPPCGTCPKIPPGVTPRPENAAELDAAGRAAYRHYLGMRAVGFRVPEAEVGDPLVRHHAALIRSAEDEAERVRELRREQMLLAALATAAAGKAGR